MEKYYFIHNDFNSQEFGIQIKKRPIIPIAVEKVVKTSLDGLNGDVYKHTGTFEDIEITVGCLLICEKNKIKDSLIEIRKWLTVGKTVAFSDDYIYLYKIKDIIISEVVEAIGLVASFEITFVCDAYKLTYDGLIEQDVTNTLYNNYDISKPIYKLYGEGLATLEVNGTEMVVNVSESVTIDTSKRAIYNNKNESINATVDYFDFEDFYLKSGSNDISASDGFTIGIIPNWGCIQ